MEFEERYFREELDYLRQLSKLLATEKPHLARFLAEKDADPDIERLLEGVAFLTGNLRQIHQTVVGNNAVIMLYFGIYTLIMIEYLKCKFDIFHDPFL